MCMRCAQPSCNRLGVFLVQASCLFCLLKVCLNCTAIWSVIGTVLYGTVTFSNDYIVETHSWHEKKLLISFIRLAVCDLEATEA